MEELARKGIDTLRYGALKPVGIVDPATGHRPWAVVQLRAENRAHTAYNLVGFQTNLTWDEQRRVFRMIPGLEHAEFARYGVMHRNTFVDSPRALDKTFAVPGTTVRLAGQITGTEGYVEAIASGVLAAANVAQPMHVNYGIIAPLGGKRMRKAERYRAYAARALRDLRNYLDLRPDLFADENGRPLGVLDE